MSLSPARLTAESMSVTLATTLRSRSAAVEIVASKMIYLCELNLFVSSRLTANSEPILFGTS